MFSVNQLELGFDTAIVHRLRHLAHEARTVLVNGKISKVERARIEGCYFGLQLEHLKTLGFTHTGEVAGGQV